MFHTQTKTQGILPYKGNKMVMVDNGSHIFIAGVQNSNVHHTNLVLKNTLIVPYIQKK